METPAEIAAFVADHFGDTHTLSVPRARFIELGGYPTGYKVCEDVHFLTRLVAKSRRIGVVCQSLGVYVIHGGSATRRDPVAAQRENVRTLTDLSRLAENFPSPVRQGVADADAKRPLQPRLRLEQKRPAHRRSQGRAAHAGSAPRLEQPA